jgi:(p)ppGpp synthase/HD superfamily hydrolase
MNDNALIPTAQAIATIAHRGQTDKAGAPYIEHPKRVAALLEQQNSNDIIVAAGWLHDVVEDSDITLDDLLDAGIPSACVQTVNLLTRRPDVPYDEYYRAISQNGFALRVKVADIRDNTDIRRLAQLDPQMQTRLIAKYATALDALGV